MNEQRGVPAGRQEFKTDLISEGIRHYWLLILLNGLFIAGLIFAISSSLPEKWRSVGQVEIVNTPASTVFGFSRRIADDARNLQNEIRVAYGEKVYGSAANKLGRFPKVNISTVGDNNMLNFSAVSSTAAKAQQDATKYIEAYIEVAKERMQQSFDDALGAIDKQSAELKKELAALATTDPNVIEVRTAIRDLEVERNKIETASRLSTSPVEIISNPYLDIAPFQPTPKRNALIAFVLSILPSTAAAALMARYRRGLVDVSELLKSNDLVTIEVPSALVGRGRKTRIRAAAEEAAIEIDAMGPRVGGAFAAFIVLRHSTKLARVVSAASTALQHQRGSVELFTMADDPASEGLPAYTHQWKSESDGIPHDIEQSLRAGTTIALYTRFDDGGDALRPCEYASTRVVVIERNLTSRALFDRRMRQLDTLGLKVDAVIVV